MMSYFRLLRPHQWVKNVFVFAGAVFGQKLGDPYIALLTVLGFFCISLVSSSVYVINDIRDREEDRLHPRKRLRPIASGAVPVGHAWVLAALCLIVGLGGAALLSTPFALVSLFYFVLQMGYNLGLKHAVLLDVILIAIGFVLRAVAGAVLVEVEISIWLVLCTFTICLFMGFSKRRAELTAFANGAGDAKSHRRTLASYTPDLLNQMTTVSAGIAILSFMLYVTDDATIDKFGTDYLAYTLPLVVYAVFRFALLVERGQVDGPTDVMLRDRPFQAALIAWAIAAIIIVYWGADLRDWIDARDIRRLATLHPN